MLKIGDIAPDFNLVSENLSNASFKGKKVIVFFYPKDNTPGCTAEACSLRDGYTELQARGFELVGVSPDSESSHKKFSEKFSFPFPLVADPEKKLIEAYGVWGEKKMYGKPYFGVFRTTFILDENGILLHVITDVKTKNHAEQLLNLGI
ncbi:MAG TPA: thioredoxin-dependent thiol peroxidase [Bacteroidales bacterium]|nr:thioredoxin-dependent thiol peroxidase [Bacteroidales bacterium]